MSWSTSDRRQRLPDDWPKRVAQVKARAKGRCEATRHAHGCTGTGAECDHIVRGDNHDITNLQWLSTPCHKAKTAAENAADRKARQAMRQRPREQHPGAI